MVASSFDCLVVGCGLSGSVVARYLAEEKGKSVLIVDRRDHVGGNMFDCFDEHGILVHKYGPHTFHTHEKYLFEYMSRFATWSDFRLTCGAEIDGIFTPTPFNFQTIDDFYEPGKANLLRTHIKSAYGNRETVTVMEMLTSGDKMIRDYAQFLFDKDYSLYTAKQWGISPFEIDKSVLERVPIRLSYKNGYFDDEFQVMPCTTYVDFFDSLLDHPHIEVRLESDASSYFNIEDNKVHHFRSETDDALIVYTGPLDELFMFAYGELPYRSLRFDWKHDASIESYQTAPVVAYPQAQGFTRITEYKKLPPQGISGTTYAIEYPVQYDINGAAEPYYPVLTESSKERFSQYQTLAQGINSLYTCGRLADFRYYNMDQALKQALNLCEQISKSI